MPEGDTIFRAAATLHRVLAGKPIVMCDSTLPSVAGAGLEGQVVLGVEARGKNLLVRFDDGRVLHTHMKMKGSWHIYRAGERWLRKTEAARVVLATAEHVAVCFSAPVVRLLTARMLARDASLTTLGPDLLAEGCDLAGAAVRLRSEPGRAIGDALMQQRHVAGIGNAYKSEVLFLCRVSPFVAVASLEDATLMRILEVARAELSRNSGPGMRTTRRALAGPRLWVYMRSGKPCLVCGERIAMKAQGSEQRSTYYCRRCQRVEAS